MELPADFPIENISITNNQDWIRQETKSKRINERQNPGQRWDIKISSIQLTADEYFEYWAVALALEQEPEFTAVLPRLSQPRGTAQGAPKCWAAYQAGVKSISTIGWTANQAAALKRGDFFRFAGHGKTYLCLQPVVSGPTGTAEITFIPGLQKAVALNEALIVKDVPFTLKTERRPQNFNLKAANGVFSRIEIDCVESL